MTGAYGIAVVSWLLKSLLDNGMAALSAETGLGDVQISSLPPDRVVVGSEERPQLNLFLYRLAPNTSTRTLGTDGDSRTQRGALALDLHYMITAYGEEAFQSELLLGCALRVLNATPMLTRESVRAAFAAGGDNSQNALPPALRSLSPDDVAAQVERVTLTPNFLGLDDTIRVWSALQTKYRLSATYVASVVMVEGTAQAESASPTTKAEAGRVVNARR